jgi:glycosyltransferase involved in cell wall biosynthesis
MVACNYSTRPPRVSVVIPTHNYGRFLWQAIESVLAQDFTDFELILSDDASTDESASLIAEYARCDPRIHAHVHRKNLGMVENWNWCLRQARGEYVKFLFGDDSLVEADALSRLVAALDAEPRATLAASARLLIDEYSRPLEICNDLQSSGKYHGLALICRCMREDRNLIGEPSAVLFRREAATRGFDPALRQVVDQEFWYHLLLQGDFVYVAEPLCAFRQHGRQQTIANRRVEIGPMESLFMTVRYIDSVANAACGGFTPWERRGVLYQRLYYSRKNVPRTPAILAAEAAVCARLSRGSRGLLWFWHKVRKPVRNLRRFARRRLLGRPDHRYTDFERLNRMALAVIPPSPFEAAWRPGAMPAALASRHALSPITRLSTATGR